MFIREGDGYGGGQLSTHHAHGVKEREPVRVFVGFQRRFVDRASDGEVSHHEAVELLADEVRRLAAQDDPGAPQMGLEFVERGFDFPALMIEGRQMDQIDRLWPWRW